MREVPQHDSTCYHVASFGLVIDGNSADIWSIVRHTSRQRPNSEQYAYSCRIPHWERADNARTWCGSLVALRRRFGRYDEDRGIGGLVALAVRYGIPFRLRWRNIAISLGALPTSEALRLTGFSRMAKAVIMRKIPRGGGTGQGLNRIYDLPRELPDGIVA